MAKATPIYDGWQFWQTPDGACHVRGLRADGQWFERHYDEDTAAAETVNVINAVASGQAHEAQLDLWRRVIGEERFREALAVCGEVARLAS